MATTSTSDMPTATFVEEDEDEVKPNKRKGFALRKPPKEDDKDALAHLEMAKASVEEVWGDCVEVEVLPHANIAAQDKSEEEDDVTTTKKFLIPSAWMRFNLRPEHCGDALFLNAEDSSFYTQTLANPVGRLWILVANTSLKQGGYVKKRLIEEGLRRNIQVRLVNPHKFDLHVTSHEGAKSIVYFGARLTLPDAVMSRLGAACDYYGLAVLRELQSLGVRVFNNAESISISRDKLYTAQMLAAHYIPTPNTFLARYPFDLKLIGKRIGWPLVVKKVSGARGEAVWKVDDIEEAEKLVEELISVDRELKAAVSESRAQIREIVVQPSTPGGGATPFKSSSDEATTTTTTTAAAAVGDSSASDSAAEAHWQSHFDDERTTAVAMVTSPLASSGYPVPTRAALVADAAMKTTLVTAEAAAAATMEAAADAEPSTPKKSVVGASAAAADAAADDNPMSSSILLKKGRETFVSDPFVFQEFIGYTRGRDLRVFTVGDKVVACMMRHAASGNFKANIHQGGAGTPVKAKKSIKSLTLKTASLCHLDISGCDLMMSKDGYVVCEINSSPGFEGLEAATCIDVAGYIFDYVIDEVIKHRASRDQREADKKTKLTSYPLQKEHRNEDEV